MTFRTRVLLAITGLVVLPLAVFGFGARHRMLGELRSELERRADALVAVAEQDLRRTDRDLAARVQLIAAVLAEDEQFRRALGSTDPADRTMVEAWAGRGAARTGLSWIRVIVGDDRVVSAQPSIVSGRPDGAPVSAFAAAEPPTLITLSAGAVRQPALARSESVQVGLTTVTVMAAVPVDPTYLSGLARSGDVGVVLQYPQGVITSEDAGAAVPREAVLERATPLTHVSADGEIEAAQLVVAYSLEPLNRLRRSTDRWLAIALGLTTLIAVVVSRLLASRLIRPLEDLAAKTSRLDLDSLESEFWTGRLDEIGTLSRMLDEMTGRLRTSADRIRESERRAARGDLARRVNHDIRNGLVPIRNVLDHLAEVRADDPQSLARVFDERRGTLEDSVDYLQEVAGTYSRVPASAASAVCDVGQVVRELVRDTAMPAAVKLETRIEGSLPDVGAEPVAVRRVLDNLVRNARESFAAEGGTVLVLAEAGEPTGVRVTVRDTGEGMTAAQLERAFEAEWTTRDTGTGLGLPIVRGLMTDIGGTVSATSEPGSGSEFVLDFPGFAGPGDET